MRPVRNTICSLTILVLFFSAPYISIAQEREDDEELRAQEVREKYGRAFKLYTFAERKPKVINLSLFDIKIEEGPRGTSSFELLLKSKLRSILGTRSIIFSFYVDTRIYGSPGWDEVARPRMSLSINPITGWYYWDF